MATPTSIGVVSDVTLYGSNYIDSLLHGKKWGGVTGTGVNLTYSFGYYRFGRYGSHYKTDYGIGQPLSGFAPLSDIQKSATQMALAAWSEIANITFTEVTDSATVAGDLRFAKSDKASPTAHAYTPSASPEAGDVWFSHDSNYDTNQKGTYGYATFLHEIGHTLGLKHPHENYFGGAANPNIDTTAYSIMSYNSYVGEPGGYGQNFYPTTPMLNDIAAIQYLYGANMTTRSGDTTYSWAPGQQLLETIWDAGGIDTIDWSNQTSAAKIDLNAGQWSELGPSYWNGIAQESRTLAIAHNVTIENARGGASNDIIIGNAVNNLLEGGTGHDALWGNAGNDSLFGDNGNDYLNGGTGNDSISGGAGYDTLLGYSGNDTLIGGGGNDTLYGGVGADRFVFNSLFEGIDIIKDFQWTEGDEIQISQWGFGITANSQFSYNYTTGALFFDASVNDFIAPTQFATIENKPLGFSVSLNVALV